MSSLSQWIQRRVERFARAQKRQKPNAVRALAEGDSWFSYGGWMWGGRTLIEQLNEYQTVNVVSLAQPGAELAEMVEPANRRQWLLANNPEWLDGETYDVVLLSGGGNDVVGSELAELLYQRSDTRQGINQIKTSRLLALFGKIKSSLASIRETVDKRVGQDIPIIMHGYDYAHPSGKPFEMLGGLITVGPWIKNSLVARGVVDDIEQRVIVNHLIDEFNDFLADMERRLSNFHYLDLRNTLSSDHWADELHPTAEGRAELAKVIRRRMVGV